MKAKLRHRPIGDKDFVNYSGDGYLELHHE